MEEEVGYVSHYFGKIGVAAIEISRGTLKIGDIIHIKGSTTDFQQSVDSMQIKHNQIEEAKAGDSIGIKVTERVREGDKVYKVI